MYKDVHMHKSDINIPSGTSSMNGWINRIGASHSDYAGFEHKMGLIMTSNLPYCTLIMNQRLINVLFIIGFQHMKLKELKSGY